MERINRAKLTVVGAGPGDPELITIKGALALADADVVLYDALANPALLAYVRAGVPRLHVGKRRGERVCTQEEINGLAAELALLHGHVVRLKGGDPFVFGRGWEELRFAAEHGIETAYIPGISSAIGVPGLAGIPVTHRGASHGFRVVTGTTETGEISPDIFRAAEGNATVVVLMGAAALPRIARIFSAHGKGNVPAAVIRNGSLPDARAVVGTVDTIAERAGGIGSPAVIVIGEVVALSPLFAAYAEERVTRARGGAWPDFIH